MKKLVSFILIFISLINIVWVSAATDGAKTIYIFVKDRAGNIQMVPVNSSITLDTTNPSIAINTNPDNTQTQTKTVRATITDLNLDTIKYIQIPSATTCNWSLTFVSSYTSWNNIVLSAESDNNTKICFQAKDSANNYTYLASNTIENIDRTAPGVTVIYKNALDEVISVNTSTTTRKVSATISDPTTGSSNFWNPTLYVSPTLAAWTYSNSGECAGTTYNPYLVERTFSDPIADNGKQMCFKWTDPAGNISYQLVTVVLNAIPTFTSVSKNDSYINATNMPAVSFTVNWIFDNDNDPVAVKYSWDWTNYTTLTTLNSTSTISNHGPFTLDTTSLSEWSNTLYIKLNDWNNDSSVRTTTIFKDSILPVLTIHNIANTNPEQIKYLSWVIADTNSFSGYIKIVNSWDSCSAQTYTTTYTPGQNITLDNESYNGKKVCFKAIDEYSNVSYSESSTISWIDTTPPAIPTSLLINNGDLFTNSGSLNLNIVHPNEADVYEWCTSESNDYNSCIWTTTKPTIYNLQ